MVWLVLSAVVVVGIVAVLLIVSRRFGDGPSELDPADDTTGDASGRRRRMQVRRDASSGFPNMQG